MTAERFERYAANRPDARFTSWLRAGADPDWTAATEHRFVRELADDTLDDAVFRRYLVQDYAFVRTLVGVVGYAVGQAPTMADKRELSRFLSTLADEENDYFERSFDALGVPPGDRTAPELAEVTAALDDLMVRAAHEGDYEETLAVLLPAEWVYLVWASSVPTDGPSRFYLTEWIELHDNPPFEAFVEWLRSQLDDLGPALAERRQRRVARLFRRTVALEVAFFDMAYD